MRTTTLATFGLTLAATLFTAGAHADEQVRSAPAFTAIRIHGPMNVTVDAGKPQSLTVRGDAKYLKELSSEVVNGELRLSLEGKNFKARSDTPRVVVGMPALRALAVEGAGEIKLNEVRGERLDVDYRGAGRVAINGEVKTFSMKAEGVGEVDARSLVASDVDIRFRGVGEVSVFASNRLDAVVDGIGSLTYYGRPRIVNKSASGIGSVRAGD